MTIAHKLWTRLIALALIASPAAAQALVFSATTDIAASPVPVYEEELHAFDGAASWPVLTRELLGLCVGDVDGDALFNDQPADIDAAHATGLPAPGDFYLSVTADFVRADGVTIRDGDIFHFGPTGPVVDFPEAFFEGMTGTTTIDVDGFAIGPANEIYFSFADDETTTSLALIAQNGGNAVLDEQTVFRYVTGATEATIYFTQGAVVAMFNQAFGASSTTVVDIDGIEIDPTNAGELLLTSLSTAAAFRGKVLTTAGGGAPFAIGGVEVNLTTLGLPATSLDALALTGPRVPVLRALPEIVSVTTPTTATVASSGWAPGTLVHFVATPAIFPLPPFTPLPSLPGYPATPLDLGSDMIAASLAVPAWLVLADTNGVASYTYGTIGVSPGMTAVIQCVALGTGGVSTPAYVTFTP